MNMLQEMTARLVCADGRRAAQNAGGNDLQSSNGCIDMNPMASFDQRFNG
jgi:hypothetical protein